MNIQMEGALISKPNDLPDNDGEKPKHRRKRIRQTMEEGKRGTVETKLTYLDQPLGAGNEFARNHENVHKLHEVLQPIFDKRPNPNKFVGIKTLSGSNLYTEREIAADLEETSRLKLVEMEKTLVYERTTKEKEDRKFTLAELLPAILVERAKDMFNMESHLTAEPDDVRRGVDCVMAEGLDIFGCAVDATLLGSHDSLCHKKFSKLDDLIQKRELTKIRYVDTKYIKGSAYVPRFVVSGSTDDIAAYAEIYLNEKLSDSQKSQELAQHPFECILVEQLSFQVDKLVEALTVTNIHDDDDHILKVYKVTKKFLDTQKQKTKQKFPRYDEFVKNHKNTRELKLAFSDSLEKVLESY